VPPSLIKANPVTTSPSLAARYRPWLVVAVASAAVLAPAMTAAATWQNSAVTLIEFRDVCRDGIRFGGAVEKDTVPAGPFKTKAIAVQPPPANWGTWKDREGEVMKTSITIPEKEDIVQLENGGTQEVSHEGDYTTRYRKRPLDIGPVALNLENGNKDSDLNTANVTDCFLYAPIDVEPGKSSNKVPIGHGEVSVAALGTRIMRADGLTPSDFRFGPGEASATGSELRDVNGDDRSDLVLRFSSVAAGLTCSTRSVLLVGKSPSGGTFEGTDKVSPKDC